MTAEERQKSTIVKQRIAPTGPRKSILRPNFEFKPNETGNSSDEDPLANLDARMSERLDRNEESKNVTSFKSPPVYQAPVYNIPGAKKPPTSTKASANTTTATSLAAPTFTYQSAYK